jgi:hypothetical protein
MAKITGQGVARFCGPMTRKLFMTGREAPRPRQYRPMFFFSARSATRIQCSRLFPKVV